MFPSSSSSSSEKVDPAGFVQGEQLSYGQSRDGRNFGLHVFDPISDENAGAAVFFSGDNEKAESLGGGGEKEGEEGGFRDYPFLRPVQLGSDDLAGDSSFLPDVEEEKVHARFRRRVEGLLPRPAPRHRLVFHLSSHLRPTQVGGEGQQELRQRLRVLQRREQWRRRATPGAFSAAWRPR